MLIACEERHTVISEKLKDAEEENISLRMEREEFLRSTDFLDGTSADLKVTTADAGLDPHRRPDTWDYIRMCNAPRRDKTMKSTARDRSHSHQPFINLHA